MHVTIVFLAKHVYYFREKIEFLIITFHAKHLVYFRPTIAFFTVAFHKSVLSCNNGSLNYRFPCKRLMLLFRKIEIFTVHLKTIFTKLNFLLQFSVEKTKLTTLL